MSQNDSASTLVERQQKLAQAIAGAQMEALALNPGPSLVYLTGVHFHLSERPIVAFFTPKTPPLFVLPELETLKLQGLPFPAQHLAYGEEPESWQKVFTQAARSAKIGGGKIGIEATRLRFLELQLLKEALPQACFIAEEGIISGLRSRKDQQEISAMRRAVEIAQQALVNTLPHIRAGVSERELASEITLQLLRLGSEPELAFSPIVSGGPNSANPHAFPGDRSLQAGDLLVIDWGATYQGYVSDLTRTFAIGEVEEQFMEIARIVEAANAAGREAVRPGVSAAAVDRASRQVIEAAGYGQYFTHRTGHGIGLEGHEAPTIRADNPLLIQPDMTFTIEPGIYLPGRGGVRVEDDLVVTEDGAESLSDLPRNLQIIEI